MTLSGLCFVGRAWVVRDGYCDALQVVKEADEERRVADVKSVGIQNFIQPYRPNRQLVDGEGKREFVTIDWKPKFDERVNSCAHHYEKLFVG